MMGVRLQRRVICFASYLALGGEASPDVVRAVSHLECHKTSAADIGRYSEPSAVVLDRHAKIEKTGDGDASLSL